MAKKREVISACETVLPLLCPPHTQNRPLSALQLPEPSLQPYKHNVFFKLDQCALERPQNGSLHQETLIWKTIRAGLTHHYFGAIMNRIALTLMLIFAIAILLFSGIFVQSANSQFIGSVYISDDGSVVGTDTVQRDGNVYILTANISGGIQLQKSNIVIDGADYTVQGNGAGRGLDISNSVGEDPSRSIISNVTVKNLRIVNFGFGIATNGGGNHTFYNVYVANCSDACINLMACSYNNITFCTIESNSISMNYQANYNTVTKNNFLNAYVIVWLSGYETIDMNYWSDYNGTDSDGNGIGDTPYGHPSAILDNHPLMKPVTIPELPDETNNDGADKTKPFPTLLVVTVTATVGAVVGSGLLFYFRKRKH
jgi:hypothetical protein